MAADAGSGDRREGPRAGGRGGGHRQRRSAQAVAVPPAAGEVRDEDRRRVRLRRGPGPPAGRLARGRALGPGHRRGPSARASPSWTGRRRPATRRATELLMDIAAQVSVWAEETLGARAWPQTYWVEEGGVYMKDAAVLAGLGCIGRNNLLVQSGARTEAPPARRATGRRADADGADPVRPLRRLRRALPPRLSSGRVRERRCSRRRRRASTSCRGATARSPDRAASCRWSSTSKASGVETDEGFLSELVPARLRTTLPRGRVRPPKASKAVASSGAGAASWRARWGTDSRGSGACRQSLRVLLEPARRKSSASTCSPSCRGAGRLERSKLALPVRALIAMIASMDRAPWRKASTWRSASQEPVVDVQSAAGEQPGAPSGAAASAGAARGAARRRRRRGRTGWARGRPCSRAGG